MDKRASVHSKEIVLIGGGGHCKVVIDSIRKSNKYNIIGIVDTKVEQNKLIAGVPVLGGDDKLKKVFSKGVKKAFIAIGSIGDCDLRVRLYKFVKKIGFELPVIIHPSAVIGEGIIFEEGAFVSAGVVINPYVKIGRNAILNTSSSIDHDCVIGDFVQIAPNAALGGGVTVGDRTHVGIGASIMQGIDIGRDSIIGMGAVVRHNIGSNQRYF